jgi:hypothetical protein
MLPSDAIAAVAPLVVELERLGVAYYVGGSVVSSTHGIPRSSLDVDIIADLAPKHVTPLVDALKSLYYIDARMIQDAIARRSWFNLIHLATSFKVDVFAVKDRTYDRVVLDRIRKTRVYAENPSTELFLASPEDIVLAKLEWYRLGDEVSERQWNDVMGVLKVQGDSLDRSYLAKWAAELNVADLLEQAWKQAET